MQQKWPLYTLLHMPIEEEHFHNQKKFMNSIDKELIATKKLSNILILEDIRNMKNI